MILLDLDGIHVNPDLIAVVRAAGKTKTVIFTSGNDPCSAGHLIDMPIDDVLEALRTCRYTVAMQDLDAAEQSVQERADVK